MTGADRRHGLPDPADTIIALATAQGPGARAILRLSGPDVWPVAAAVFHPRGDSLPQDVPRQRTSFSGRLLLLEPARSLPADLYFWPGPRSYTGQDTAELHTLSCPPLVELAAAQCLQAGARAAQPGEFTLRAFLAGKLDLTRAEAVLGVIEAGNRTELKHALAQLAGGVAQPLQRLRDDLLDLLADVEAGLDFSDEDIQFADPDQLLHRLADGLALVTLVQKQLGQRSTSPRPFRAVLVGRPNAGKSSLFNALAGKEAALVSSQPGTTRDFLSAVLTLTGPSGRQVQVELVDTAGLRNPESAIEASSQALGLDEARQADLLVWCREANAAFDASTTEIGNVDMLSIATKCDLAPALPGVLSTSAATGVGLEALRQALADRAQARNTSSLAPSLSRCQHHTAACLDHLRRAHACVLHQDPPEILAAELRAALEELGAMVGAVYTDDLLDRIFSRFCIGK